MMQGVEPADTHLKPLTDTERERYRFETEFGYVLIVND